MIASSFKQRMDANSTEIAVVNYCCNEDSSFKVTAVGYLTFVAIVSIGFAATPKGVDL